MYPINEKIKNTGITLLSSLKKDDLNDEDIIDTLIFAATAHLLTLTKGNPKFAAALIEELFISRLIEVKAQLYKRTDNIIINISGTTH